MKAIIFCAFFLYIFVNCGAYCQENPQNVNASNEIIKFHSKTVKDDFYLQIHLPEKYLSEKDRKFTTVYVLDGNVYFGVVCKIAEQYEAIGLMPPVIVVGIGYKNLSQMETKRSRDFLFPKANPEYQDEFKSGGGEKFLSALINEIVPYVDGQLRTKPENRILLGHSFGGYFCLFALLNNLNQQNDVFRSYIAASPSIDYNNQYLLSQFAQVSHDFKVPKLVYTSIGDLEDQEERGQKEKITEVFENFNQIIGKMNFKNLKYKGQVYSNFAHKETAIATFDKGLLYIYRDNP
jgi:uncharacterized protein